MKRTAVKIISVVCIVAASMSFTAGATDLKLDQNVYNLKNPPSMHQIIDDLTITETTVQDKTCVKQIDHIQQAKDYVEKLQPTVSDIDLAKEIRKKWGRVSLSLKQ